MNERLISVIIPVYNEEAILRDAALGLRDSLSQQGWSFEVIFAENGSSDATVSVLEDLCNRFSDFRYFSLGTPNYGAALKAAIFQAKGEFIICEEIDLCDRIFHKDAVSILQNLQADFVVGSKLLGASKDERPLYRHGASFIYSTLLKILFNFRGTDTHGLKAFRASVVRPIAQQCKTERDVFASELVIRAEKNGIRIKEIPVRVLEKRPPSINLFKRVPAVLSQLAKLTWSIRFK